MHGIYKTKTDINTTMRRKKFYLHAVFFFYTQIFYKCSRFKKKTVKIFFLHEVVETMRCIFF